MMIQKTSLTAVQLLFGLLSALVVAYSPAVQASGSIGAGAGGISQYGALYKQGKSVFFRKLACNRAHCAFGRSEVNEQLAKAIVASLATRSELKFEVTETDSLINQLCPGPDASKCSSRVNEQEAVKYYLSRRYGVSQ